MSAFGFDKADKENGKIKENAATDVQTEEVVEEVTDKVSQTAKSEVGDIISTTKKGKK